MLQCSSNWTVDGKLYNLEMDNRESWEIQFQNRLNDTILKLIIQLQGDKRLIESEPIMKKTLNLTIFLTLLATTAVLQKIHFTRK